MLSGHPPKMQNIFHLFNLILKEWKECLMENCGESIRKWLNLLRQEILGSASLTTKKCLINIKQFHKL